MVRSSAIFFSLAALNGSDRFVVMDGDGDGDGASKNRNGNVLSTISSSLSAVIYVTPKTVLKEENCL